MSQQQRHRQYYEHMIQEYWDTNHDYVPLQDANRMINDALRKDEEYVDLYHKIVYGNHMNTTTMTTATNSNSSSQHRNDNSMTTTRGASHLYFPYHDSLTNSTINRTKTTMNGGSSSNTSSGTSGQITSSLSSNSVPPEQYVQYMKSIPLPELVQQQLTKVRMYTNMGLLSLAHLAYISIDDQLYLWSYDSNDVLSSSLSSIRHDRTSIDTTTNNTPVCSFVIPSGQCIISVGLVRPKKGTGICRFFFTFSYCVIQSQVQ